MPEPRPLSQRKTDTLALLTAPAADAWVATASVAADGQPRPYLVPLSLAWLDERVVLATSVTSRTARSIVAAGVAVLSVGATRDVVHIEAAWEQSVPVEAAPRELGDGYAAQADWDPRGSAPYVYLVLRPTQIRAWREVNELANRTLMTDGRWLT